MSIQALLEQVRELPSSVQFNQVIDVITKNYQYRQTKFVNGELVNEAGSNEGSCKIFAFAQLHQLSKEQTLHLFGDYYRVDVLQNPAGSDHGNIRNFMQTGWEGVDFEQAALTKIEAKS